MPLRVEKLGEAAEALKYFLRPRRRRRPPVRVGVRANLIGADTPSPRSAPTEAAFGCGSIEGAMHAGVAVLLPCAQHASRPRALAISILELSQVTFRGSTRAMTDESPRCQFSPLHGGDARRFANG